MLYFVINNNLTEKEMTIEIDLTNLKWTKNVNHPDLKIYWSYRYDQIRYPFLVPEFNLHWKKGGDQDAQRPQKGDMILLRQRTRVTHLVKILDDKPISENNGEYPIFRRVQLLWMEKEPWDKAPHQDAVFGFDVELRGGALKNLDNIKNLVEQFSAHGGITAFHSQISQSLGLGK